MTDLNAEQVEILGEFARLLRAPTADGRTKREANAKPLWKVDPDHEAAMRRHLHRYDRGERVDADSGAHPLVHVAWRALALAWQETEGRSRRGEGLGAVHPSAQPPTAPDLHHPSLEQVWDRNS